MGEKSGKKERQSKMKATKDYKLLSFGDEAEEDEDTLKSIQQKIQSKSSHDLLNDPKLLKETGIKVILILFHSHCIKFVCVWG